MERVITCIANREQETLTLEWVDSTAAALATQGMKVQKTAWLAEGTACDLFITDASHPIATIDALLQQQTSGHAIDAVVQPAEGRRKQLLISDMDSTIITIECIDELADFVGKKAEVARITERAMNGELNFETALAERVALLAGLPEGALQQAYDERVRIMPGARELVTTMAAHGAYTVLVSGGFTFFTSRVRDALGFHEDHANRLEIKNGKLTGRVTPPILGKEAKLQSLKHICAIKRIPRELAMAVGDGANDLPMLQAAGLGIAYHAKPIVREAAQARISHCDLRALLYVQGYSDKEITG